MYLRMEHAGYLADHATEFSFLMLPPIISLPGVIIIDILSSLPPEVYLVVLILVVLLIASYLLPSWFGKGTSRLAVSERKRLSRVHFEPRSVMSPNEALLYNALHMVVRDRFLLLAKVPIRNLIQMNESDPATRRAFVHVTKNVTADFIFLHPGSLVPEKVVFVGSNNGRSCFPDASVLDLLRGAQIGVAHLTNEKPYTVAELTEILELGDEE